MQICSITHLKRPVKVIMTQHIQGSVPAGTSQLSVSGEKCVYWMCPYKREHCWFSIAAAWVEECVVEKKAETGKGEEKEITVELCCI